jgi:hypothetical protein
MRRRSVLATALGVAACQIVTHAHDYGIPDYGICSTCGYRTDDLRRPPCPPRAAPAGSDRYVYAWRRISLGGNPETLDRPGYDVGFDQDCSTRAPSGLPAMCEPVFDPDVPPSQLIPLPAWAPLPHGIDNSLGQRFIAPLLAFARSFGRSVDVDALLSQALEQGTFGEIVVVDGWNGTADDDDVSATFVGSSHGTQGSPPRWDGEDVWVPNSSADSYPHLKGYVSGGMLVVDSRGLGEEDSTFTIGSASAVLQSRLLVRAGAIAPSAMRMVTYGRINLADMLAQVPGLATFLSNGQKCDMPGDARTDAGTDAGTDPTNIAQILCATMPNLLRGAADLPAGEVPTPGQPCEAISLAAVADAYRAKLAP